MSKYKTIFILLFSFFQLFSQNKIDSSELKKTDSLQIFPKNNLMSELIGNWRMIDDTPSWVMREDDAIVGQMITITTEEIQFFDLTKHAKSWRARMTAVERGSGKRSAICVITCSIP